MKEPRTRRRSLLAAAGGVLGATLLPTATGTDDRQRPHGEDGVRQQRDTDGEREQRSTDGNWQQRGGDAAHAGYQSGSAFPVDGAAIATQTEAGVNGQPVVVDGTIYEVDQPGHDGYRSRKRYDQGRIRARDVGAADTTWEREFDEDFITPAVVGDGVVYAAFWDGRVRGFDAETGETTWTAELDVFPGPMLTVADGTLYVPGETDDAERLVALDAATGEERWRNGNDWFTVTAPTVHDGVVYTGFGGVTAYDAATGDVEWEADARIGAQPLVATDDALFVGGDTIAVLDPSDGRVRWRSELDYDREEYRTAAATDGDAIYLGFLDHTVARFDIATGDHKWTADTVGHPTGPLVVADDAVYATCDQEFCYAFDPESGEERWRASLRERASLALADDSLFAASAAGLTRFVAGDQTKLAADRVSPVTADWVGRTDSETHSDVLVGPENVYFNRQYSSVHAFTRDGDDEWETDFDYLDAPASTPALGEERVFVTTADGYLVGVDRTSGQAEWSYDLDADARGRPRRLGDVVVAFTDETAFGVDAASGEERWTTTLEMEPDIVTAASEAVYVHDRYGEIQVVSADGTTSTATPTTDSSVNALTHADGSLYASSETGVRAYSLDETTPRWEYVTEDRVRRTFAVHDGVVYLCDWSGTVAAVDASSGEERWTASVDGTPRGGVAVGGGVLAVCVRGETAWFFAAESGDRLGRYDATDDVSDVEIAGERAYVLDEHATIHAVALPDPSRAKTTVDGTATTTSTAEGMETARTSADSTGSGDGATPGFSGVAAGSALLGVGAWLRRRRED